MRDTWAHTHNYNGQSTVSNMQCGYVTSYFYINSMVYEKKSHINKNKQTIY